MCRISAYLPGRLSALNQPDVAAPEEDEEFTWEFMQAARNRLAEHHPLQRRLRG